MPLHVRGPVLAPVLVRLVVDLLQAVFDLKLVAKLAQDVVGVERLVDGVAGRVNLVDRDVDVQVVGVVVDGADALVFAETDDGADALFDGLQGRGVGFLAGREGNDQVIGLVRRRPGVLDLRVQYFEHGDFRLLGLAVGGGDRPDPFVLVLGIGHVLDQFREVAFLHGFHGDVPDDHSIRPETLAAKVFTAAPSVSAPRA